MRAVQNKGRFPARASVLLNGAPPRARKWVCPKCDTKALGAHVAQWQALAGRSFNAP